MSDVKLSIIIATYCQKQYIEKAIKSVMLQKVNFPFEVFVGDDCSTDGTVDVLKNLEKELPDNYHILYRKNNLGVDKNNQDMIKRSSGEYIIFLEGDDYYTSQDKLQKQVDFLDTHPEYIAVAHNTMVVDAQGAARNDFKYPECKKEEYSLKDFCEDILAGQTATLMFRNIYKTKQIPIIKLPFYYPGDQQKNFMLASFGKVYCIQEALSAYRYVPEFGTSYVANNRPSYEFEYVKCQAVKRMYKYLIRNNGNEKDIILMEQFYMKLLSGCAMVYAKDKVSIKDWIKAYMSCKHKYKTMKYLINWRIDKIFKRG